MVEERSGRGLRLFNREQKYYSRGDKKANMKKRREEGEEEEEEEIVSRRWDLKGRKGEAKVKKKKKKRKEENRQKEGRRKVLVTETVVEWEYENNGMGIKRDSDE